MFKPIFEHKPFVLDNKKNGVGVEKKGRFSNKDGDGADKSSDEEEKVANKRELGARSTSSEKDPEKQDGQGKESTLNSRKVKSS